MLYLSANAIRNMQMWRETNSAVSNYWHTKAIGKPYGMPRSVGKPNTACGLKFDCQNGIAWKRERRAAFTTDEE
jgi:hypothetical protein